MDQEDRIYTTKVISLQHYHGNHGNIIHSNHYQPNKDFKVFKKSRVNNHLLTLLLSMVQVMVYAFFRVWPNLTPEKTI